MSEYERAMAVIPQQVLQDPSWRYAFAQAATTDDVARPFTCGRETGMRSFLLDDGALWDVLFAGATRAAQAGALHRARVDAPVGTYGLDPTGLMYAPRSTPAQGFPPQHPAMCMTSKLAVGTI